MGIVAQKRAADRQGDSLGRLARENRRRTYHSFKLVIDELLAELSF